MKTKYFFTVFLLLIFCSEIFSQYSSVQNKEKELEEHMREIIRDSLTYEYFMAGIELEKKLKRKSISDKEYASKKNELQKLKIERRNARISQRNVISSNGFTMGAETCIAVNQNNPNEIVAAYMDNSLSGCAIYFSADGGATWNPSSFVPETTILATIPGVLSCDGGGDPTITVDNNGVFYFAWIAAYTTSTESFLSTLYVTSSDGGLSFTAPPLNDFTITAYDQTGGTDFFDRIWIAADASSASSSGTVYLNGMQYGGAGLAQWVYIKEVGNTNFYLSPNYSIPASIPIACQMANIDVGDNGVVHATGIRFDISTDIGEVVYSHSFDKGLTWSSTQVIAPASLAFNGSGYVFPDENAAPSLGVDSNTVYIAWTEMLTSPKVFYAVSNDDGNTWSAPIDIGTQLFPGPYHNTFINLSPSNGNCSMAWYKIDSITGQGDYIVAEIKNNGTTPIGYEVISPGITNFPTLMEFFGHYNVCRRVGCITYAIWAEGSSGSGVAYTAKVDACSILSIPEITPIGTGINFQSIFPVPAEDKLQINFSIDEGALYTISIFDINGKQIIESQKNKFTKGENSFEVNVSGLSSGPCLLQLKRDNGIYLTRKFVKK